MAAAALLLAFAAGASAAGQTLYGQYLTYNSNGSGRFTAEFDSHHGGSSSSFYEPTFSGSDGYGDAGIALTIYGTDAGNNPTATVYGVHGQAFQPYTDPQLLPNQPTGTQVLSTTYLAGDYDSNGVCLGNPCLRITENAEYTYDGDPSSQAGDDLSMKYHVDNDGTDPVRFRLTAAGDTEPGYGNSGTGFLSGSSPNRILGTDNPGYGARIAFEEAAQTPWTHYQEGLPYDIWRTVENPLTFGAGGLSDSVRSDYVDSMLAAEWDGYATTGLPADDGGTNVGADFQYLILFHDWKALSLDDPQPYGSPGLAGNPVSLHSTAMQGDGTGGSAGTSDNTNVLWRVSSGPDSGASDWAPMQTASATSGSATLTFTSDASGGSDLGYAPYSDIIQAFLDENGNGVRDDYEPYTTRSVFWNQPIQLDATDSYPDTNSQDTITVTAPDGLAHPFEYKVSGANPQGDASNLPNGGIACDPTLGTGPCSGMNIPLTGLNPGTDAIDVWMDLDNDNDTTDPGEHERITIEWSSPIYVSPQNLQLTSGAGKSRTITATIYVGSAGNPAGQQLYYRVDGANSVVTTAAPLTTAVDAYDGSTSFSVPGTSSGQSTITIWQDTDASGGPSPTPGDSVGTSTIDWVAPDSNGYAISRLTIVSPSDPKTFGQATQLSGTLLNDSGTAETTPRTIRYEVSGPDGFPGYRTVTNATDGTFSIPLAGVRPGEDYVTAYADYNNDGSEDSNEPSASAYVDWTAPIAFQSSYDYYYNYDPWYPDSSTYDETTAYVGSPVSFLVYLRAPDGTALTNQAYHWSVTSGPNQGLQDTNSPVTASGGTGTISYSGNGQAGSDIVDVSFTYNAVTYHRTFEVDWEHQLTLQRSATDLSTDATATITATLKNSITGAAAPAGTVLAYEADSGENLPLKPQIVQTDSNGQASISWVGHTAESDYVTVWADYNHNGVRDPGEPSSSTTVTFHQRVEVTSNTYSLYEGATKSVTVTFRDDNYQPLANKQLKYMITGANPVAAPEVTTDSQGKATISWVGNNSSEDGTDGQDTLVVWQDTNGNDVPDADEHQSAPYTQYWYPRLSVWSGYGDTIDISSTGSATASLQYKLVQTDGSTAASGQTLAFSVTGANPTSGTVTTDSSGIGTVSWTGTSAGYDSVTVWNDANGNGVRDPGEPIDDEAYVYWTNKISLSPTNPTKWQGDTQVINASSSESGSYPTLCYSVSGANSQAATQISGGQFTLSGTNAGTDYVVVWDQASGACSSSSAHTTGRTYMTWKPRISLAGGLGTFVAGGQVSVTATLVDISGNAVLNSPTQLEYRVTGANPVATTPVTTNNAGNAVITWSSTNYGTDTLTVWKDDISNGQPDSGEFVATRNVYWSPPPVKLSLAHTGAQTALQDNQHTVTATLTGLTIPAGGLPIHFAVSGANSVSDTLVQSDASGVASFQWTGSNDGTDTVTAYADVSGATGTRDAYDPTSSTTMTWTPLVQSTTTTADQVVGQAHTETLTIQNPNGTPAANVTVLYQITGANPTNGLLEARPVSAGGTVISARTDATGTASITWTGSNTAGGTDTLTAWGDTNNNGLVDATDPKTVRTVTWRTATAASSGTTSTPTTTPTGSTAAVTPGSVNDFDGLPAPPPPVVAKSVNVEPVSGHVFVRLPSKKTFIELLDAEQIPVGSVVDVRKGTVALTSAQNLKGGVATANFYAGEFVIGQKKASKPITDLSLFGGNFKACKKILKGKNASLAGSAQKKKIRELWGQGHGLFRTKGKYASAAIRGTKYDVVDYCDGTLVKVAQGKVAVQNFKTHKTQIVKAPKSLFIPAK